MFRILVRLVPLVLLASFIAGCGNKGDLVKPSPKTASQPAGLH